MGGNIIFLLVIARDVLSVGACLLFGGFSMDDNNRTRNRKKCDENKDICFSNNEEVDRLCAPGMFIF